MERDNGDEVLEESDAQTKTISDATSLDELSEPDLNNIINQVKQLTNSKIEPNSADPIKELETHIRSLIKGSANQALAMNTFIIWTAFAAAVSMGPVVNSMPRLPGVLKSVLVAAPLFPSPLQFITGKHVDKTGGQSLLLLFRMIGLVGMAGLTTMAATADLATVDRFDVRYFLMLACAIASGVSLQIFPLLTSLVHWKAERAGHMTAVYAGVGGSALAIAALTLQYMLDYFGLTAAMGLLLGISTLGTAVTKLALYPSPYHQLLAMEFDSAEAKLLASHYGQKAFPSLPDDFANMLLRAAKDPRTIALTISVYGTFGGFLSASTSLFLALINILKLSPATAVTLSAVGSLWATSVRTISGIIMDRYDPSGGPYSIMLSTALSLIGALMLAIPSSVSSLEYVVAAVLTMYTGFGIGATATFRTSSTWATKSTSKLQLANVVL